MSMKNSNNNIGNRNRELSVCRAVLQPTAASRVPVTPYVLVDIYWRTSSVPPSLGPKSGLTENEDGSTIFLRNVGKY
jgi:hypothetical protein